MSSNTKPSGPYRWYARKSVNFTNVKVEHPIEFDGETVLVTKFPATVPLEQIDGWHEDDDAVVVIRLDLPRAAAGRPWRLSLTQLAGGSPEVPCDAR